MIEKYVICDYFLYNKSIRRKVPTEPDTCPPEPSGIRRNLKIWVSVVQYIPVIQVDNQGWLKA